MSREVIITKTSIYNCKLLRCETKVYTPRKKDVERLTFTLVSGFEAYSAALRGTLTC